MRTLSAFSERLRTDIQSGKYAKPIRILNRVIKIALLACCIFTALCLFVIPIQFASYEVADFTVLQAIYIVIIYAAFYLITFSFLPIVCFLILTYFLSRKYGFEALDPKQHFRLIVVNVIVITLAILTGVLCYLIKTN